MKKVLKGLAWFAGIAVIGMAAFIAYVKIALPNVGAAPDMKIELTKERIERGNYLANHVMLCMDCHSTRDWTKFAGPPIAGTEGIGGEVFDQKFGFPGFFMSRNITPFALKDWTDGEIFRVITTGVNKHGKALFPIMPYKFYRQLDEEDIKSVIAYIRTLPAQESTTKESVPDFPFNIILNTIPEKAALAPMPPKSDVTAYGKYMATASGCAECHTKQEKGKIVGELFAGGFEFNLGNGTMVRSPNITPHETGLGDWSRAQFIQRFKQYTDSGYVNPPVDLAKKEFQTVMPWSMYAGMTEEDLGAIFEYLKTVTPVNKNVQRFTTSLQ